MAEEVRAREETGNDEESSLTLSVVLVGLDIVTTQSCSPLGDSNTVQHIQGRRQQGTRGLGPPEINFFSFIYVFCPS